MKENFLKIITSPITYFNVLTIGVFIFIGVLHEYTHHQVEVDVHGYVRQFCSKNLDTCETFINEY